MCGFEGCSTRGSVACIWTCAPFGAWCGYRGGMGKANLEDADIEGATAEVEHEDGGLLLLVETVRQRRGRRLVDDAQDVEPRNPPGILGEGGRYSNYEGVWRCGRGWITRGRSGAKKNTGHKMPVYAANNRGIFKPSVFKTDPIYAITKLVKMRVSVKIRVSVRVRTWIRMIGTGYLRAFSLSKRGLRVVPLFLSFSVV